MSQGELDFEQKLKTEFVNVDMAGQNENCNDEDSHVNILSEVGDVLSSCVRRATLRIDGNYNAAESDFDDEDSIMQQRPFQQLGLLVHNQPESARH